MWFIPVCFMLATVIGNLLRVHPQVVRC